MKLNKEDIEITIVYLKTIIKLKRQETSKDPKIKMINLREIGAFQKVIKFLENL